MRLLLSGLVGMAFLGACASPATPTSVASAEPGVLVVPATPDLARMPALAIRATAVTTSLQQPASVLRLSGLDAKAARAQDLALADRQVLPALRSSNGDPLRNEVFQSRPAGVGDLPPGVACAGCYRVEIYQYATNSTLSILVDPDSGRVVDAQSTPNSQPEVPKALADLAVQIAIAAPEVGQALGVTPDSAQALMPQMKTALNQTRCERAQHLCVAPTFRKDARLLWAVVDLTDMRLVGTQWSDLGPSGPPITEKTIENSAISTQFCERDTVLTRDGWSMRYRLTSSDGLEIRDVTFNGQPVIESIKLVDWHVSYSGQQQFGYSDATGCPLFSSAAVPAYEPPEIEDIREGDQMVGFALIQDFKHPAWPQPCNYFYSQRTEFYNDGGVRPLAINLGRGCGTDGTYRPVQRIALAGQSGSASLWSGSAWEPLANEAWRTQEGAALDPNGGWLRVTDGDGRGFVLAPGQAGAPDQRGDNAYLYITHTRAAEGVTDLPTIGACCNADEKQGPDVFVNNEAIAGAPLTIWYVGQMHNDATPNNEYCWADSVVQNGVYVARSWPCQAGPRLTPIQGTTP